MSYRVLFLMLLALMFMVALAAGNTHAQSGSQSCDKTVCGPGYKPVLQSNGSCMCVLADCESTGGCPPPPKAVEDCDSIEGCGPPQIIKP